MLSLNQSDDRDMRTLAVHICTIPCGGRETGDAVGGGLAAVGVGAVGTALAALGTRGWVVDGALSGCCGLVAAVAFGVDAGAATGGTLVTGRVGCAVLDAEGADNAFCVDVLPLVDGCADGVVAFGSAGVVADAADVAAFGGAWVVVFEGA